LSPPKSLKAIAGPKQWILHARVIPLTLKRLTKSSARFLPEIPGIDTKSRGGIHGHHDIFRRLRHGTSELRSSPIRSILQKAAQERLPHRLYLFYSNREVDDAAFIEEFEDLSAQNSNFTFIPTLTGHRAISWPYEKGYIDREMLTRYLLGLKGPTYYIAGPSGMVTAMTDLLNASGVSDDDVKSEEFGDYRLHRNTVPSDSQTAANRSDLAV
jgi:hypothetical protein